MDKYRLTFKKKSRRLGEIARYWMHRLLFLTLLLFIFQSAESRQILLQSTTSTQSSGLFDVLLPIFEQSSGIEVLVVAVGTGQALRNAANGDADVLMVHAQEAEEEFILQGHGVQRHPLMYNRFVVVGPSSDPAAIGNAINISDALNRIYLTGSDFISRGDDSGTHKRELSLWMRSGFLPTAEKNGWYKDVGSGMGRTLGITIALNAYTLSDEGTWIAYKRNGDHGVLFADDPNLLNQYSVILVNPKRHKHVNERDGQIFIDWLLGEEGQEAISRFRIDGKQLFYPNANKR